MLQAIDFQILRAVVPSCRNTIKLARKPNHVMRLLDEAKFLDTQALVHRSTVFFDDEGHDWAWSNGSFRYFASGTEPLDILVVYRADDIEPVARFHPMTGLPLAKEIA